MGEFNYFEGIREDVGNMIGEIGTECTIYVPNHEVDAYGNHVSTDWSEKKETIWVRQIGEVMDIQNIGQLNREDIRFEAAYDSEIVVETKIVYRNNTYAVIYIDKPDESGNLTHLVGYAKKMVT